MIKNKDGFKSMELSNVVAPSTLRLRVFDDVARAIDVAAPQGDRREPGRFSSQSVSNILWAAGNHPEGHAPSKRLLDALAHLTVSKFDSFTPQGLEHVLGFAAGYNPGRIFRRVTPPLGKRRGVYNVMEMSNLLWAFHTLQEHPGEDTLAVVGRRLLELDEDLPADYRQHDVSLAQFEYLPGPATMRRLEETCVRWLRMPEKESATAGHMLEPHMASARLADRDDFFAVFNDVVARRIDEFTDQGVSNVVFTYGNLGVHPDARLLETLDAACLRHMDAFLLQGAANTLWVGRRRMVVALPPGCTGEDWRTRPSPNGFLEMISCRYQATPRSTRRVPTAR